MEKILVSACLLGERCKYSGDSNECGELLSWLEEMRGRVEAVPACPEVMGGLPTPRTPAEICKDRILTQDGRDVTAEYRKGAADALALAQENGCRFALLKERSPSCGCGEIYDGTFTHSRVPGDGVTAGLLKEHGITVCGETQIGWLREQLARS